MNITDVINGVLRAEGGYVNDPADRGGETNFGITKAVAVQNGYTGDMRSFPVNLAYDIYYKQYVKAPKFDQVGTLSVPIAAEMIDTGVNMGPRQATLMLQRALNALNNQGADYPDMAVDGLLGPGTLGSLKTFLAKRGAEGEKRLLALLNALQGERYVSLCEGRSPNEKFMYGWLARIL